MTTPVSDAPQPEVEEEATFQDQMALLAARQSPAASPRRRQGPIAGLLGVLIAGAVAIGASGGSDRLSGIPLLGRDAADVYSSLKDAGFLIAPGRPASRDYDRLVSNNSCQSSRTFVRTNADVGWAVICVDPPRAAYRRISDAFDEMPMLMGPLYAESGDGEVVVFGFGWPANTSRQIYNAIGGNGGTFLVKR